MIDIKNKVLVKLKVPEIDCEYDVFLPINKKIGNIINLLNEVIEEITNGELKRSNCNQLFNAVTNEKYNSDILLLNTNIRNGTYLVLIS